MPPWEIIIPAVVELLKVAMGEIGQQHRSAQETVRAVDLQQLAPEHRNALKQIGQLCNDCETPAA